MGNQAYIDFCAKCNKEHEIAKVREVRLKRACGQTMRIIKGVCPICGSPMGKLLPPITKEETSKAQKK